jgi:hypothetical protein
MALFDKKPIRTVAAVAGLILLPLVARIVKQPKNMGAQ